MNRETGMNDQGRSTKSNQQLLDMQVHGGLDQ
jgi:hypothetical protein